MTLWNVEEAKKYAKLVKQFVEVHGKVPTALVQYIKKQMDYGYNSIVAKFLEELNKDPWASKQLFEQIEDLKYGSVV